MFEDTLKEINSRLKNVHEYDMDDIDDVRKAKKDIEKIKEDLNSMSESNSLVDLIAKSICSFIDIDLMDIVDNMYEYIVCREAELENGCAGCTCCECDKSCDCDDEYCDVDDEDDEDEFIITKYDVYDALFDELEEKSPSEKMTMQLCEIIANYLSDDYFEYVDLMDEDMYDDFQCVCNDFFNFALFILNR